ncbi:hypothetical protein PR003_g27733 [Phytophthora rubi]|uniref:Uncharacterized protein n=1 Tax=Phytophthora rubi TaxID=129364 RepID=A0A6A4BVW2_9STRA|nr:hypothetical protein PR001_g26520 [Phytophthora rubi]KAE9281249.1 hypothetical protein PR003_g27733 [Phytophthora rubi]
MFICIVHLLDIITGTEGISNEVYDIVKTMADVAAPLYMCSKTRYQSCTPYGICHRAKTLRRRDQMICQEHHRK